MVKTKETYKSDFEYLLPVQEYFDTVRLDKSVHTIRAYTSHIDNFLRYLEVKEFDDLKCITSTHCRAYQSYLKKNGMESNSINAHNRSLRAFFNWLVENELLEVSPFKNVKDLKPQNKVLAFLSNDEIVAILKSCENIEEKTMFAFYIYTGMRNDELASLTLDNQDGSSFLVAKGKGNKQRWVSVPDFVYELYLEYLKYRNNKYNGNLNYIFVSRKRCKYSGEAIRYKFKEVMKRAGFLEERIDELHVHSLRHTFSANQIENGTELKVLQAALGHSDISVTANIYAHVRNSVVQNAMKNQKNYLEG